MFCIQITLLLAQIVWTILDVLDYDYSIISTTPDRGTQNYTKINFNLEK
jgi:hypothetical protein